MRMSDWSSDVCSSDLPLDDGKHLSFVVAGPTGVEVVAASRWLKWRRRPLMQRIHRLHVVVPINQHRRLSGCVPPLCIHDRRSEERRVWTECVSTSQSGCAPYPLKTTKVNNQRN